MNMKLSYRDQVILIVVVVLVTLALGFFLLVKPQMDSLKMNEAALVAKQQEKAQIEERIASIEALREKVQVAYEEDLKLQEFFLPEMDTYELDQFLYPMLKEHNMKIEGLSLTQPNAEGLPVHVSDYEKLDYALKQYADVNNKRPADGGNAQSFNNDQGEALAVTRATFTFHSSIDDMKSFLDAVQNDNRAYMVTDFTFTSEESFDVANNPVTGNITMIFYSMDRVELPVF